jgi:uncharacterized protein (TIRG00374 family)
MRLFKIVFFTLGLFLLGWVIQNVNIEETFLLIDQISFGIIIVIGVYFIAFLFDTVTWQITILSAPLTLKWVYRLFQLRLSGEAFNNILPAASMGGEPIKAILLKNLYGLNYHEGIASLILARTINTVSLILFLIIGFLLMIGSNTLGGQYNIIASAGLIILSLFILCFFLVQRFKITSYISKILSRNKLFHWLNKFINHVIKVEDILVTFYKYHYQRTSCAFILAFMNWVLGATEIFITMHFIGHPISLVDAWIIEAIAQLVRTATFFIPASIGAQEGAFLIIGSAVTGSPTIGFTMAIVRRAREIIWITWGLLVFYTTNPNTSIPNKK